MRAMDPMTYKPTSHDSTSHDSTSHDSMRHDSTSPNPHERDWSEPPSTATRSRLLAVGLLLGVLTMLVAGCEGPTHAEADEPGAGEQVAVFAGGCFWCMEPPFDKLPGVVSTTSGYSGGSVADPTYDEVSAGGTGHLEVVQVVYDPSEVSYETLLETYWANVDPLDGDGQFCDRGRSYAPAIFPADEGQRELAEASLEHVTAKVGEPAVEIIDLTTFYPAEDYHQDYYEENTVRYEYYRWNCGRDQRLEAVWGDDATKSIDLFEGS